MRERCHIEGCEKQSRGHGLCATHWLRWRKWGDPYWADPKQGVKPHNFKQATCSIDGCDRKHHAHGYCSAHAAAFRKHGSPTARGRKGRKRKVYLTSAGAHKRVMYDRGKASEYDCVDCGRRAQEWSCRHDVAPQYYQEGWVTLPSGKSLLAYWSTSSQDYDPRCKSCHRKYDNSRRSQRGAA